jgi:platelet-activating factor acetylhydrolase
MIFDHGLGGNRNTYSHLVGSVASHGVIVITPEHRDGSAPISHVRDPASTGGKDKTRKKVDYYRIAHQPSAEVQASRTAQLKIRLWEMGCIYDALHKIDAGVKLTNLNTSSKTLLPIFSRKLAIHEPGTVTFAGHSFGATTTSQLLKSTFYGPTLSGNAPKGYEPLFTPSRKSLLAQQITPNTPTILLDLWCLPLRAHSARALWNLPFPAYAPDGPGGSGILEIESQAFIKWLPHLKETKQFLSPDPSSPEPSADPLGRPPVRFYYPANSAHLSQSDFGILFPWATKKMFGSDEPERLLKLNTRAILQMMRERGIPVSGLSRDDLDDEETMTLSKGAVEIPAIITSGDPDIFADEQIRGWKFVTLELGDLKDVKIDDEDNEKGDEDGGKDILGAVVEGEVISSDDDSVAEAKALGGEIETKERNGRKEVTKL